MKKFKVVLASNCVRTYEVEAETTEEAEEIVMSGEGREVETEEYDFDILENEEIKND
jgi:hypothetical protein